MNAVDTKRVETLYSEDLDNGATYDSVEIVNPFR
jgi:predicted nucleic acid-binding protein